MNTTVCPRDYQVHHWLCQPEQVVLFHTQTETLSVFVLQEAPASATQSIVWIGRRQYAFLDFYNDHLHTLPN